MKTFLSQKVFCSNFADVKSAKIGYIRWETANKFAFHSFAQSLQYVKSAKIGGICCENNI